MYSNIRKYVIIACLILAGMLEAVREECTEDHTGQQIYINEVSSWNKRIKKDSNREYSDYIELHNSTDTQILLAEWQGSSLIEE